MLVKLWDIKIGKVLFILDSYGGKEEFILFGVQFNFLSFICLYSLIQFQVNIGWK